MGSDRSVDYDIGECNWIIALMIPRKPKLEGTFELASGSGPIDSNPDLLQSHHAELVGLAATITAAKLMGAYCRAQIWKVIHSFDKNEPAKRQNSGSIIRVPSLTK